jgi:hypothetical protein
MVKSAGKKPSDLFFRKPAISPTEFFTIQPVVGQLAARKPARYRQKTPSDKPSVHLFPLQGVHELAHSLGHDGHLGTLPSPRGHRHGTRPNGQPGVPAGNRGG